MYNNGNSSKNVTGASIVDGTVETVDIADDAVTADKLANTVNADIATGVTASTTAGDALPKTGGAMTGAITTNSTFDGRDVATDGAALDVLDLAINSAADATAITIEANENVHFGRATSGWFTKGVSLMTGGSSIYTEFIRTHTSDASSNIYMARANNGNMLAFVRNDGGSVTVVGSVSVTASATSYNTSSDYRLKENVVPMTGSIDRLKALKPSKFNFIKNPDTTVDGFLAHEAQTVVPEAVTGTKDAMNDIGTTTDAEGVTITENRVEPAELEEGQTWTKTGEEADYQGIDQAKLVPLLVSALQEAIARIETLENA